MILRPCHILGSVRNAPSNYLRYERPLEHGEHLYTHELTLEQCGKMEYRIRAFPTHAFPTHPFEMGMMVWL